MSAGGRFWLILTLASMRLITSSTLAMKGAHVPTDQAGRRRASQRVAAANPNSATVRISLAFTDHAPVRSSAIEAVEADCLLGVESPSTR
jgi:hypothetical protein